MVPMLSASIHLISKQILAHRGVLPVHCDSVNAVPSSQRSPQGAVWSCSKMHVGRSGTHLQFVQPGCPEGPPGNVKKVSLKCRGEAHFKRAPIPTSLCALPVYFLRRGAKNSKSPQSPLRALKSALRIQNHSKKSFFVFSSFAGANRRKNESRQGPIGNGGPDT